jgi:hypothetical protein
MNADFGLAIVARDPAASETAVGDAAESGGRADLFDTAVSAASQLSPLFVPMLNCGNWPSNNRCMRERMECAS